MPGTESSGNPNPDTSGLIPFKPGQSGNPGGKTKAQRKAEVEAGERAARIEAAMLKALEEAVSEDAKAALEAIKADPLKLIQSAIDRSNGKPIQTVDNLSSDGSMTPGGASDEELEARILSLQGKLNGPKEPEQE